MMRIVLNWSKPVLGILLCAAIALLAAMLTAPHSWRVFVPAGFVAIVVLLSFRYGVAVGIFGSVAAVLVFAYFFSPFGSLQVANSSERAGLAWMLLGGITLSFLLAPPPPTHPHSK
jgi:K+-sensing histidine kinase KdpD